MTDTFGINEALAQLGLKEMNNGTSTGSENFSNGSILESFSPVDGKLIGKVKCSSTEDYENVMASAKTAFRFWRSVPAPKRETLCVSLVTNSGYTRKLLVNWFLTKWASLTKRASVRCKK